MGALSIARCKIHDSTARSFDLSEAESQEVMTARGICKGSWVL